MSFPATKRLGFSEMVVPFIKGVFNGEPFVEVAVAKINSPYPLGFQERINCFEKLSLSKNTKRTFDHLHDAKDPKIQEILAKGILVMFEVNYKALTEDAYSNESSMAARGFLELRKLYVTETLSNCNQFLKMFWVASAEAKLDIQKLQERCIDINMK